MRSSGHTRLVASNTTAPSSTRASPPTDAAASTLPSSRSPSTGWRPDADHHPADHHPPIITDDETRTDHGHGTAVLPAPDQHRRHRTPHRGPRIPQHRLRRHPEPRTRDVEPTHPRRHSDRPHRARPRGHQPRHPRPGRDRVRRVGRPGGQQRTARAGYRPRRLLDGQDRTSTATPSTATAPRAASSGSTGSMPLACRSRCRRPVPR